MTKNKLLERVCGNTNCGRRFYCHGECKNKIRISLQTHCYCSDCFHKYILPNLASSSLKELKKCPRMEKEKTTFIFREVKKNE